jgi:serine/threonine-protein kinase
VASVIETVRSDPQKGTHSVVGSMLGTPAYMPPEQATGDVEHMDQRSDVFGLGAMLCEVLTGEPPYLERDGDLTQQAARADLQGAHQRIEQSGADAELVALCKQCLSPARRARPESAQQVADVVARYLTSVEERAREAQVQAAAAKVRARSTVLLSMAAVLLFGIAGGGYLYIEGEARTRREQAGARVAAALDEANVRLGEARAGGAADQALWTRAVDAASLAERLASDVDVGADQRAKVAELIGGVRGEQAVALASAQQRARDAAMRIRLIEVRVPPEAFDSTRRDWAVRERRRMDAAYAAAFR